MQTPIVYPNPHFFERILAIGPHPDDIELGCFGTLSRYQKSGSVIAHFVASCGGANGDEILRQKEATASAALIDAQIFFGNLIDTAIPEAHPTIQLIEQAIHDFKPTCLFVNSPIDTHQDHRAVARAAIAAARFVPLVMYYQTPSSNREFHPNLYIDITNDIEVKMNAISIHQSQGKNVYMADRAIRGLADFMALQIYQGGKYFEGFEIYQMII